MKQAQSLYAYLDVRSSWRILAGIVIALAIVVGANLWLTRRHTIVYRASAAGCEAEVLYDTHEGTAPRERFRERWERGPIELVHGDVANIHVFPSRECGVVRCELVEDGRLVAVAESVYGATCSALTSR